MNEKKSKQESQNLMQIGYRRRTRKLLTSTDTVPGQSHREKWIANVKQEIRGNWHLSEGSNMHLLGILGGMEGQNKYCKNVSNI